MPATLETLRARGRRLRAKSARTVMVLDAAFSEDILEQVLSLAASGTGVPAIRRRGRRSIQLKPSPRNVLAWSIGQRIRAARERKGWRQEDLAQETGIARANIARLEKGHQVPKVPTLRCVAGALGLEADALLKAPEPWADTEDKELGEAGLGEWTSRLEHLEKAR